MKTQIFIDGSNLFGSLKRLQVQVDDYELLFSYIMQEAANLMKGTMYGAQPVLQLIRTNWYVVGTMDTWDFSNVTHLRELYDAERDVSRKYLALAGPQNQGKPQATVYEAAWDMFLEESKTWYDSKGRILDGMHRFYHGLRRDTDFIDLVEAGHWKIDMVHRFVMEKGVDVKLAIDMVKWAGKFDIALMITGDADLIPAIELVKRSGAQVGVIEFIKGHPPERKGRQSSGRLKAEADFVVQIFETDLTSKKIGKAVTNSYHGFA